MIKMPPSPPTPERTPVTRALMVQILNDAVEEYADTREAYEEARRRLAIAEAVYVAKLREVCYHVAVNIEARAKRR